MLRPNKNPRGSAVLVHALICSFFVATTVRADYPQLMAPPNVATKSGSEFYSTNPNERVLIPINVWGEVKEPGIHYVPTGTTVLQSISFAGGPLLSAQLPDVRIIKPNGAEAQIDVFTQGGQRKVVANETIQVDYSSFRVNLPVILGIASTTVSIATLLVVLLRH